MFKYCILSATSNIDLESSSMELRVCDKDLSWVLTTSNVRHWKLFNTRSDAEKFIKNTLKMTNAFAYGIDLNNY